MTYEEHLDEVTTLITEKYDVADDDAIAIVMRAQADDFIRCGIACGIFRCGTRGLLHSK